jgi:hypothetical protein
MIDGEIFIFIVTYTEAEYDDFREASLRKAVALAQKGWVNTKSNKGTGYVTTPAKLTQKPSWYNGTFQELLKNAFRGLCIDLDHSLVQQTKEDRRPVEELED